MTPENMLVWTNYYQTLGYTERRIKNALAKDQAKIDAKRSQKPVAEMTITIEWKKSKTWGMNPHASARIKYMNESWGMEDGFTCSGCGYDKESTVVAKICNNTLAYLLYQKIDAGIPDKNKIPYGISLSDLDHPYFDGGVGMSCYPAIFEFLGGKCEQVSSGKSFDVYKITINQ